jgi:hypothetical protein
MTTVYDNEYASDNFNAVYSNSKIETQLRDLVEYLNKYDIGSERKKVYREEALNMGIFIYYMRLLLNIDYFYFCVLSRIFIFWYSYKKIIAIIALGSRRLALDYRKALDRHRRLSNSLASTSREMM